MDLTLTIPAGEWRRACELAAIVEDDERADLGSLRLRSNGSTRRWYAANGTSAAFFDGDPDPGLFDVGVPPSILRFAEVPGATDAVVLHFSDDEDGNPQLAVTGPRGTLRVHPHQGSFPHMEGWLLDADRIGAAAHVRAMDLHDFVQASLQTRERNDDGSSNADWWIGVVDGNVIIDVLWSDLGPANFRLDTTGPEGAVVVRADPLRLLAVLELFDPHADLALEMPRYVDDPVVLRAEGMHAIVRSKPNETQRVRAHVESVIESVAGRLAIIADADGDYPLQRRATPIYARLRPDADPPTMQVFAVLLNGVEASPELHTELNDLNASTTFAKVFHAGRQVLAVVDLAAQTLDAHELITSVRRIREVADAIAPTLATVFGGELAPDPAAQRRAYYRHTIIEVEFVPGSPTALNGVDALDPWPWDTPIHVLTGWNPQGAMIGDDEAERINIRIAEDILTHGGKFAFGAGRSPDGTHREPSLVAWGLTRDDALDMGRKAAQDAIFELTRDEIRFIDCLEGTVTSWARREEPTP